MYYLLKKAIRVLFLSLFSFTAYAQQKVTGTVKDATGEPMIGVNILADGNSAAVTDFNGNFAISNVTPKTIIKVSYIGYKDQEIRVGNSKALTFVMQENSEVLDEVVVVGYGTMKKSDLTGAISSISSEEIVAKGSANILSAMQGSVAGVNITQSSSRAGGTMDIEIRGKSSINSDTSPLFIVDGVMCDDIDFLNEQDIEKIDILKDASSTAIYGSRATAGVVMVTTKGGLGVKRASKPTISYDGYYGVAAVSRMPDFQNAQEFYTYRFLKFLTYEGGISTSQVGTGTPTYVMTQASYAKAVLAADSSDNFSTPVLKNLLAQGVNVDWPSYVTQDGKQQNHYVSFSGSTEHISYNIGLGYNDVEGVYVGDEEQKITFKSGLDADINKYVSVGFNFNMAYINHDYTSDDAVKNAYYGNPFASPYDEDGNIIEKPAAHEALGTDSYQFSSFTNPLLYFDNEEKNRHTWRLLGNIYLSLKPLDCLTFKTTFSPNYTYYRQGQYIGDTVDDYDQSQATMTTYNSFSYTWDNVLTFEKLFNKIHRLNLTGLISVESSNAESMSTSYTNVYEGTSWWNLSKNGLTNDDGSLNVTDASSSYTESSMLSYALRANYTLLDRYMLTATIRWDGSSKFADGNRWGSFPSVAVAWRASEEKLIKENAPWLSNLKLRLSYGVTGNNTGIGDYDYMLTVSGPVYYPFSSSYYNGMYPSGIVDSDLQWEKSTEYNLGIDFGFLKNRIHGSVDIYTKKSKQLLYDVTLPYEVGAVTMTTNIGSVQNRGIEATLTGVVIHNKDWNWTITANYSHNSNHVKDIDGVSQSVTSGNYSGNLFIGASVNNVYGYQWTGIVTDGTMTVPNNSIAVAKGFTPGTIVKQTDYYYACYGWTEGSPIIKDVNGDGNFDDADKKVYRCDPAWTGSLTTSVSYKNWDFSATIYTKQHFWVYSNFYEEYCNISGSLRGRTRLNMDFYIPSGTLIDCDGVNNDGTYINPTYQASTKYGKYPFPSNMSSSAYTYWYSTDGAGNFEKVSFTKVKNITLGYTFPKKWTRKFGCQTLRLYINVTNPIVITSYKGFDPEWADAELADDGPSVTTWQFGANIKF